ncbi:hypothetical protein C8F04DRAFT_639877 [Mycena alexandri]|uniref:N-acetyltransferase domain-containing protein n=1 Tax=Mycena alexandri TaxID=1745969 RepID=A0AAD6X5J1_9AGAR|nr:hypothetical protein C8F04DRAFT_639877 [Mycena alexandri]
MDAKPLQPPTVAVPRPGGDIIIRQYQPRDAAQVHALLVEGLVYGPLQQNFTRSISCLTYLGVLFGLGCVWQKNLALRLAGSVLTLGSAALFAYVRKMTTKMFVDFCAKARETDMKDIMHSYEIPHSADAVQGPGGFWVAAIESLDKKTSEVVGYLGLDYRVDPGPTSGELRRMIVSMNHRRRKIGSLLITAAVDHARKHSPPLITLDLETTEFQPGAQKLYENHGFILVGQRTMRISRFFSMTVVRLRRKISD